MEKLIEKNYLLHKSAQEAYKSYIRAFASHSLKNIYDVNTLDLQKVALSFGFHNPPYVDLGEYRTNFILEINLVFQQILYLAYQNQIIQYSKNAEFDGTFSFIIPQPFQL